MAPSSRAFVFGIVILAALGVSAVVAAYITGEIPAGKPKAEEKDTYTVEVTDYAAPPDNDHLLADDRLEEKKTSFDPALVDRRAIEGWSVNTSAAVLRLDVPIVKPDRNPERLVLHPSYSAAVNAARGKGEVLPSVNMIDGKAKQFDDGLYAAIDQAYYVGHGEAMNGHLPLIRRLHEKVGKATPAADYLAAGLIVAGEPVEASAAARSVAERFLATEAYSKPIGFYTWTPTLASCFRTLRFFSRPIADGETSREIARVLGEDDSLRDDYRKATLFYGKMTNPLEGQSPADLIGKPIPANARVSLFPPSTSRETELFNKLFPLGLTAGADLMRELITAIRSGKVDLRPREDGGWYDYQVYALETLLLPEKGAESEKLLLTKRYKKRMLEAFKALVTKRRETHARQLAPAAPAAAPLPPKALDHLQPRLRVEPNPTYFRRTARSYRFVADFLESALGESTLKELHGLRETGPRELSLHAELRFMSDLFYGLYFLSAEDIGMSPTLFKGESVDRVACETAANDWLARLKTDPDLAADTRVSVPVYFDQRTGAVRLWATLGVRLAALDARYATPPSVRPENGSAGWEVFSAHDLWPREYLIPVDEFAEVELRGGRVLNRAELRAVCDRMKTKDRIVEALQK